MSRPLLLLPEMELKMLLFLKYLDFQKELHSLNVCWKKERVFETLNHRLHRLAFSFTKQERDGDVFLCIPWGLQILNAPAELGQFFLFQGNSLEGIACSQASAGTARCLGIPNILFRHKLQYWGGQRVASWCILIGWLADVGCSSSDSVKCAKLEYYDSRLWIFFGVPSSAAVLKPELWFFHTAHQLGVVQRVTTFKCSGDTQVTIKSVKVTKYSLATGLMDLKMTRLTYLCT